MMFRLWFFYILAFIVSWADVSANTEIHNFEVTERQEIIIPQASKWQGRLGSKYAKLLLTVRICRPALFAGENEDEWSLDLASAERPLDKASSDATIWDPRYYPHEMWVVLDLDHEEWKSYSKFTLRLSWPAYVSSSLFKT